MIITNELDSSGTDFLVVGVAKNFDTSTNSAELGYIYLYRIKGDKLEFIHKTPTETLP